MIKRTIESKIREVADKIGVISIMGPRQSGKTTLARSIFPNHKYYNLENPNIRESIVIDPYSFLKNHEGGIILDEVQKYPELLSYIQVAIDENYQPSKYVLTGSENLLLSEKVSQSLAGRVSIFELLPLSIEELKQVNGLDSTYQQLLNGFYPRLYDQNLKPENIYPDYVSTYVERDVRQVKNIGDLSYFQRFLQLLSGRVGQLLNLSSLANDVGVDYKTIDSWISILEATYIAFRLQPYYENFGKRVIKSPKVYFYDTGLLCFLLGINSVNELSSHFAVGSIFENMIIADLAKEIKNTKTNSKLYYWRDRVGNEVDLLIQNGQKIYPVEVKLGASYSSDYMKGIKIWDEIIKSESESYILYNGDHIMIKNTNFWNWQNISEIHKLLD